MANVIGLLTSLVLNGAGALPDVKSIHFQKIETRIIGTGALLTAFAAWAFLSPDATVRDAVLAAIVTGASSGIGLSVAEALAAAGAAVAVWLLMVLTRNRPLLPPPDERHNLFWVGMLIVGVPVILIMLGLSHINAGRGALLMYTMQLWAVPLGVVLLRERPGRMRIAGSLIGLISNGIDQRVEELQKGRSTVIEHDHTVILGWSERVPPIVSELTIANESRKHAAVVILADTEKTVSRQYGSLTNLLLVKIASRNTFLIDPQGKIAKVWTGVSPAKHSSEVLEALNELAR